MDKQLAQGPTPLADEDTDAVVLLANLTKYAENARGAFAENTQRARRSDWILFSDWCVQCGLAALDVTVAARYPPMLETLSNRAESPDYKTARQ